VTTSPSRWLLSTLALAAGLHGGAALAEPAETPSIYSKADLSAVRNDTTSPLIGDLHRSGVAYVLPPTTGTVVMERFTLGQNLQHCDTMLQLQQTSRDLAAKMAAMALETEPLNVELEQLRQQKKVVRDVMADNADYVQIEAQIRRIQRQIDDIDDEIAELEESCGPVISLVLSCPAPIQQQIDALKAEQAALSAQIPGLREQARVKKQAYDAAAAQLAQIQDREKQVLDEQTRRLDDINRARAQLLSMYSQYAVLEGGTAVFTYRSGWDDNVARLVATNPPSFAQMFKQIKTRDARVSVNLAPGIGTDAYLASNPTILGYKVNGTAVSDGNAMVPFAEYPKNVDAVASVSLVAACVQAYPEKYDVEKSRSGLPLFGATVTYTYPSAFLTDVSVTYNPYAIYKAIRGSGNRLWTTRVSALLDGDAASYVKFDWKNPDLDPAFRRELQERIVHELIQDVLATVGEVRYAGDVYQRLDLPAPPRGILPASSYTETFTLRPMTENRRLQTLLNKVEVVPHDEGCDATTATAMADAKAPALSLTIALPGARGVRLTDIILREPLQNANQYRILTSALQMAKARASYECGWYSIWCDGQTWIERVRNAQVIRRLLDRDIKRVYSRETVTYRPGSTLYVPGPEHVIQ